MTKNAAERLAAFLRTLRADWDEPGIVKALSRTRDRGDAYQIAIAAVRCAADPANRTPAVIALDGRHWRPPGGDQAEPPATPDNTRLEGACRKCGAWRVRGEDHTCARRADPATVAAARRTIRQEASHG